MFGVLGVVMAVLGAGGLALGLLGVETGGSACAVVAGPTMLLIIGTDAWRGRVAASTPKQVEVDRPRDSLDDG